MGGRLAGGAGGAWGEGGRGWLPGCAPTVGVGNRNVQTGGGVWLAAGILSFCTSKGNTKNAPHLAPPLPAPPPPPGPVSSFLVVSDPAAAKHVLRATDNASRNIYNKVPRLGPRTGGKGAGRAHGARGRARGAARGRGGRWAAVGWSRGGNAYSKVCL